MRRPRVILSAALMALLSSCAAARAQSPAAATTTSPPPQTAPTSASPSAVSNPVTERAQALTEAANLLNKADQARQRGNKNFAEQLFSSAEIIVGPEAVAELATLFREGAPPRITTPLKQLAKDTPAQPTVGTSSDDEEPPAPKPKRGMVAGSLQLGGKPLGGRGVVTLEPINGKWKSRAPKNVVMEQRNREFAPKMLAVRKGSVVSFPNFDTVYHNVFSRSESAQFDLGLYKNGQARELVFDKPGIVRVGCNLHANMAGYIVVVDAPHYAITDDHGTFRFGSLSPGKYKMRVYTERSANAVEQDVVVTADATANVVVAVNADGTALSVDKFGKPRGK